MIHIYINYVYLFSYSWVDQDFTPLMVAGFKIWPLVSLLNFTVVPVEKRLLVSNLFGALWGVYLSLVAG